MWDVEESDLKTFPVYHAAALLDGLAWLESLQRVEGVEAIFDDGTRTWSMAPRVCGRYFGFLLGQDGSPLLTALHPGLNRNCPPDPSPAPDKASVILPLAWFAIVPWKARWAYDDFWKMHSIILESGPFHGEPGEVIEGFSLVLTVASNVYKKMNGVGDLRDIRTAVGNMQQIFVLGNHLRA